MPVQHCPSPRPSTLGGLMGLVGLALLWRVDAVPAQPVLAAAPDASQAQQLKAGDAVEIHVAGLGTRAESVATYVRSDGTISIPRSGAVQVAGLPLPEAAQRIKAAMGTPFEKLDIVLSTIPLSGSAFFITGDVRKIGTHPVTKGLTVRQVFIDTSGDVGFWCLNPWYYRLFDRCAAKVSIVRRNQQGDVAVHSEDVTEWFRSGAEAVRQGDLITVRVFRGGTAPDL